MKTLAVGKLQTKISSFISRVVQYVFRLDCIFFFYEPKRPEGFDEIELKDILPKKH